jgi:hypothetical protein
VLALRILIVSALAVLAAGCGEKSEPDLSEVPPPAQPKPPTPPQGLPQAVTGHWQGTLEQKGVKPFPITVAIVSATDSKRNVVRYGGEIGCSGTWTYLDADGAQVRFREHIDSASGGKCKGTGTVTVEARNAKLDFRFSGGGVTSSGVLSPGSSGP